MKSADRHPTAVPTNYDPDRDRDRRRPDGGREREHPEYVEIGPDNIPPDAVIENAQFVSCFDTLSVILTDGDGNEYLLFAESYSAKEVHDAE